MKVMERAPTEVVVDAKRRHGPIALIAVVVLALAAAGGWLLLSGDDTTTPTDTMENVAAAMRADDVDEVNAIMSRHAGADQLLWTELMLWNMGLQAEPVLSDCVERGPDTSTFVVCELVFGEDYFYSQVTGDTLTSTLSANVDDNGILAVSGFPAPSGLRSVENALRPWVEQNHPELYDQMFDEQGYQYIRMDHLSGELRMQLLDEFMATRP